MQSSNVPTRFPIPFGNSAGGSYIRAVPTASQIGIQNGAASLTDGFPPNCAVPIAGGGSWPWMQDFNGLLNQMTAWDRWVAAGAPSIWNSAFSTAIGGYPKGSRVRAATLAHDWLSTTENNVTNPDTGGAGWINPEVQSFNTRTGAVTLTSADVTTALTYTPVQQGTGVGQTSDVIKVGWSAASRLKATVNTTDLGNIATEAASNTFTGINKITQGAFGTADAARVVRLGDFTNLNPGNSGGIQYWYERFPDGSIIQSYVGNSVVGVDVVTFPNAFPNICVSAFAQEANPSGWDPGVGQLTPTVYACSGLSNTGFLLTTAGWALGTWQYGHFDAFRYIAVGY